MRSGTKYTLAACAAVGLLVLMDLLLLRGAPPPRPEVKLPDGRVFQLLGITEGKSHSLNKPGPRSFLVRFLPAPLRKMAGPQFSSSFGFGRPGLALWLMCYDPATDSFQSGWSCKLIDEHGCEFPPQGMGSTSDGYYQAHIINFPAYPRHTNSLICRLFDSNGKQLADFPIEHVPSAPPHANWIPDPLPAWKTNGPLALRLDGFDQITQPRFQVFCEGQAQVHWTAESIFLEDASGNTGEILCRKLPTWKWRATFHRTADAPFAPEEIVTFTNISLPAPGVLLSMPVAAAVAGTKMTNLTLAGPGRYEFSNDVHVASLPWKPGMSQELSSSSSRNVSTVSRSTDKTSLFLPRISIPESNKLIVRARRNGEVVATATQSGSTRSFMFYEFSPAFPTGSVDLELIIDSGYRFDYIVSPEPMPSANANP